MKKFTQISYHRCGGWLISCIQYVMIGLFVGVLSVAFTTSRVNAAENNNNELSTALEKGRLYTDWLYTGELDLLSKQLLFDITEEELALFTQLGQEQQLVVDRVTPILGSLVYVRIAYFENIPVPIAIQWYMNKKYQVVKEWMVSLAEAPSEYLDYQTKTYLRLPFKGKWVVAWGGRLIEQNYHVDNQLERFALDLTVVKNGQLYKGDGSKNEQYYCFGRPILAPADGVVVDMIDGVIDNEPGIQNELELAGNYIILDHGNNEYSFLAHLKQGTVAVVVGQTVTSGQYLGQCGNSGYSDGAHLHYHLQNTPLLFYAEGLPAQFQNYFANGKKIRRGEPTIGQFIRPAYNRHKKEYASCNKGKAHRRCKH